jgi:sugar lactone lactonase YvrE
MGVAWSNGSLVVSCQGDSSLRRVSVSGQVTLLASGFNQPNGVATNRLGNIFVADSTNNRVANVTLGGTVSTLAGSGAAGCTPGFRTAASIYSPQHLAVDSSGNLYVASFYCQAVYKVTMSGNLTLFAGSGAASYADGLGTAASFNRPRGVAVDVAGNVYIGDYSNNRIRFIDPLGNVSTLAGSGIGGRVDGPRTVARFLSPYGVVVDLLLNVWVADEGNNCIRKISPGGFVVTVAGSGVATFANGIGELASFKAPDGVSIAVDGNLHVADTLNQRIRALVCIPCPASYYCSSGAPVLCPTGSYCPLGSVNPTPCPAGTFGNASGLSSAACSGACTSAPGFYCPAGSTAANATLLCPTGAFCAGGAAPSAPCSPATACSVPGLSAQPPCYWNISTLAGTGSAGWADGQGTAAVFNLPAGVAAFNQSVYVAEFIGNRVRQISPLGQVRTVAGSGSIGSADGLGTAASFYAIRNLKADALGTLYAVEFDNHRVRKILPSGLVTTLAGWGVGSANGIGTAARFTAPTDIALDSTGAMGYVVEEIGHRIRSLDLSTASVALLAGSGVAGYADSSTGALAQFNGPSAAVWHPSGMLYIAESGVANNRIRSVRISTTAVSTVAGSGVSGGANGVGTDATFSAPRGICLDATYSLLYVSEDSGHRIRSISLSTALVQTIAGSGVAAYTDGFGVAARFGRPYSLSLTSQGVLYCADLANNRVRQLTCIPCPPRFYCSSGSPVLCPAGTFCPLSTITPTPCPKGTFSAAGASTCTQCPAGTLSSNSISCTQCPSGHACPAGTSSWALLPCGRGSYCPEGSGAPTPCPLQVPPSGGWGALQVQGPAFLMETATCLRHCFWNLTSGDGMLSTC